MGNYTLEEEEKSWKTAAKHNLYKSARNNSRASRKQWILSNTSTATMPSAVTANLEDAIAARNRCSTTTIANTVKVSVVGVSNICNTYNTITRCFLVKTILPTYVSLVTLVMLLLLTNLTKQAER